MTDSQSGPAGDDRTLVVVDVGTWYRPRDPYLRLKSWIVVVLIVCLAIAPVFLILGYLGHRQIELALADYWDVTGVLLLFAALLVVILNWVARRWHRVALPAGAYEPGCCDVFVAGLGAPVSEIWTRVQSLRTSHSSGKSRTWLSLATFAIFAGAAVVLVGTAAFLMLIAPWLDLSDSDPIDWLIRSSLLVVVLAPLLAVLSRRVAMPSARLLRERDPRLPVLFLRSFVDESLTIARTVRLADGYGSIALRFEEAIASELSHYGPFLAIGKPGEWLPQAGAAREYVAEDEWRRRVRELAGEALVVAVSLGRSDGMDWELQHLIESKHLGKVVVLVPPRGHGAPEHIVQLDSDADATAIRGISGVGIFDWNDRRERWRKFAARFGVTEWADGLRKADVTRALVVSLLPGGKVVVMESDRADERDFCLAISAAIYLMHCARGPARSA